MERFISLLGLCVFVGIAWLFSNNKKRISWKLVAWGVGLQVFFAIIILPDSFFNYWLKDAFGLTRAPGAIFFSSINDAVVSLLNFTKEGVRFLATSFTLNKVDPSFENFIFDVLPTILFFSGLMGILYHIGIVQFIVKWIARLMRVTMGTSGSESLSAAANIFVGQTEAPLVIKPYVEKMTRSELLAIMTGGMATVSGGVMAAYVAFLHDFFPDIAGHLMAASIMSAPAALILAKILVPETEESETAGSVKMDVPKNSSNVIEAAANGASDGLRLAANVAAMLLVFIALIAMFDAMMGFFGGLVGFEGLSFTTITSWVFSPLAWLMGVESKDVFTTASILGQKTIINEFVAFKSLSDELTNPDSSMSPRSIMLVTYALCGFSNFSSIAIQIGGIGSIAPSRKKDLAELGLRALLAGTLACLMTASVAGVISVGHGKSTLSTKQAKKSAAKKTVLIQDGFDNLRIKLSGKETLGVRTNYWMSHSKNNFVNWNGTFFKKTEKGILIYYGVKNIKNVKGHEKDSFLFYQLNEQQMEERKFTIWRRKKNEEGNLEKKSVRLLASQIKMGDNIRGLYGRLKEYQVSDSVLFRVKSLPKPAVQSKD